MNNQHNPVNDLVKFFKTQLAGITAETVGWLAVIMLHAATIPSMLAVMSGLTDKMPSADIILMLWAALTLLFTKAVIQRDMISIITIGVGFIVQSAMMVLIFFK